MKTEPTTETAEDVLQGYMHWEGQMLMCDKAWSGGFAEFPRLTPELWAGLLDLQRRRNAVLGRFQPVRQMPEVL